MEQQLTTIANSTLGPSALNDTRTDNLFQGYPTGLLTFASATCIVYILVGVPGNLITIIALARCKKVRNATAVFIINLSCSDLLFCCFNLPLAASTYWNSAWKHEELLCRLFPLLRYGLLAVSLVTVLAITLNRYVMIGHPRIYPRIYRRKYLATMVASTWICAFSALIPTWRGAWGSFGLDRKIGSCSILPDANNNSPKDVFFLMAFLVPCLAIIVCYARIFYIVRKTAMRSHEPPPTLTTAGSIYLKKSNSKSNNNLDHQNDLILNSNGTKPILITPSMIIIDHRNHRTGDDTQLREHGNEGGDDDDDDGVGGAYLKDSSQSISNGSNGSQQPINKINQIESENSSSVSAFSNHPHPIRGPKILLNFIDSSIDSDLPPSLSALRRNQHDQTPSSVKLLTANELILSSVSINKNVEFSDNVNGGDTVGDGIVHANNAEDDYDELPTVMTTTTTTKQITDNRSGLQFGLRSSFKKKRRRTEQRNQVDSAVDESTSSSETNQIYHIQSSENNCNHLLSVQVEPSSSSGIDLPLDEESPPRRIRRSFATSMRRIKRVKDKGGGGEDCEGAGSARVRKHSTMNTSGASILYPGRMTVKDRRLLKMIMVILMAFIACYLPITISKFVKSIRESPLLNILGYLLIYMTPCINPIIYVVMSSEYRQAYWNLLMCRITSGSSSGKRCRTKHLAASVGGKELINLGGSQQQRT